MSATSRKRLPSIRHGSLKQHAASIDGISKQWKQGNDLVAQDEKVKDQGSQQVVDGQKLMSESDNLISRGKTLIAESENAFRDTSKSAVLLSCCPAVQGMSNALAKRLMRECI